MPGEVVFIGDEVTAAGFRMAGLEVRTPGTGPGAAAAAVRAAAEAAAALFLTPAVAREVPAAELARMMRARGPLVLVVPDVNATEPPPDLGREVLGLLGIEA